MAEVARWKKKARKKMTYKIGDKVYTPLGLGEVIGITPTKIRVGIKGFWGDYKKALGKYYDMPHFVFDENELRPYKHEFKVGDRVRIRQWEDMEREFGLDPYGNIKVKYLFTTGMRWLCGKEATVFRKDNSKMRLDIKCEGSLLYAFSGDMLEPIEEKGEEKVTENLQVYVNNNKVILKDNKNKKAYISTNHNEEFNLEKGVLMNLLKMKGHTHSWIKKQFDKANGDLELAYMRLLVIATGINNDVVEELIKMAVIQDKNVAKPAIKQTAETGVKAKVLQKAKYIGKGKKFKHGEIITCIDINKHGTCVFSNGRKEEPLNSKGYVIIDEDN